MARKITDLVTASTPNGAELLEVVQSGGSFKTTAAEIGNTASNSVKLTGNQTVGGVKTFSSDLLVGSGSFPGTGFGDRYLAISSLKPTVVLNCGTGGSDFAEFAFQRNGVNSWSFGALSSSGLFYIYNYSRAGYDLRFTQAAGAYFGVSVGFGGVSAPTASIDTNGFTKLGEAAPKIKQKKLTGTTPASASGSVSVAHGLTRDKIISYTLHYTSAGGLIYPQNRADTATLLITSSIDATNLNVASGASTTTGLSRPFVALITYEE